MDENEELQEPEKKKKKKGSSLSIPMIVAIVFGVIVINIMLVIAVIKIWMPDATATVPTDGDKTEMVKKDNDKSSEEGDEDDGYTLSELDEEELEFLEKESKRKYMETEDITTNPKASSAFVIIQLGIKFVANEELDPKLLSAESDYMKKLMGNTRAMIIKEIGQHTADELLENGRAVLPDIFKKSLKPLFKEKKLFLREITITKFMVQK